MRLLGLLGSAALVCACSDDGVPAADLGSSGTTAVDEGVGTGAEVTTVSSASGTSRGSTTSASSDASATATASDDTSTSGVATTGRSSGESGNGQDEGTSGGPLQPGPCTSDRDCVLVDDCCNCGAIDVERAAPDCDELECPGTACDLAGLGGQDVQCRFGHCELVPASCNDAFVSCEVVPPVCPEGTQPETDGMDCWTFDCVPVESCDVVPSCEVCTADETCVETIGPEESWWSCEPLPAACAGVPTCGCMPGVCQQPGYETCVDGPNGLDCT